LSNAATVVTLAPIVIGAVTAFVAHLTAKDDVAWFATGVCAAYLFLVAMLFLSTPAIRRIVWGYRIRRLELRAIIDVGDPSIHHLRTRMTLEMIRAGLRGFWSGYRSKSRALPSDMAPPAHRPHLVSGAQSVGAPVREGGDDEYHYHAYFGRPLPIGAVRDVVVEQTIFENSEATRSCLSKVITEPVDKLILLVQLPVSMWPSEFEAEEVLPGQERPSILTAAVDDANHELRLEIDRPVFGREYRLLWARQPVKSRPIPGLEAGAEATKDEDGDVA
jgi:hypothetical protein